ncbi:hypothetical protein [Nonomuraea longicatena]|uniref:Uncharacterized protein n=1 Tax=Nonomuraea longicatena TaxID=83682 RepID=A0ABP4BPC6_9ACTN
MSGLDAAPDRLLPVPAQRKPRCGEAHCLTPTVPKPVTLTWELEADWWRRRFGKEARVLRHTCLCQPISYEELTCGGVYRIRRIVVANTGLLNYLSPQTTQRGADELWELIIHGTAV